MDARHAFLVAKAEREFTGPPRVKVSIEKPKKKDKGHDAKMIAVSGLSGAALTQLATHTVLGTALGAGVKAGGGAAWRGGRRLVASKKAVRVPPFPRDARWPS